MDRNKSVGTIGHVDHGKTTLTAALIKAMQKMSSSTGDVLVIDSLSKYADVMVEREITPKVNKPYFRRERW